VPVLCNTENQIKSNPHVSFTYCHLHNK